MTQPHRPFNVLFLLNRIRLFTSLPLASLDRLSLQKKLCEIGKS